MDNIIMIKVVIFIIYGCDGPYAHVPHALITVTVKKWK